MFLQCVEVGAPPLTNCIHNTYSYIFQGREKTTYKNDYSYRMFVKLWKSIRNLNFCNMHCGVSKTLNSCTEYKQFVQYHGILKQFSLNQGIGKKNCTAKKSDWFFCVEIAGKFARTWQLYRLLPLLGKYIPLESVTGQTHG